jgi:hypothetical protein
LQFATLLRRDEIIWSKLLCCCLGEIFKLLEHEEKYLVSFKRSVGYLKLLAELDLLKVIYAHSAYGKKPKTTEIRVK